MASDETGYWTIGAAGGRLSNSLLIATENVLHARLKPVAITKKDCLGHQGRDGEDRSVDGKGKVFHLFLECLRIERVYGWILWLCAGFFNRFVKRGVVHCFLRAFLRPAFLPSDEKSKMKFSWSGFFVSF